MRERGEKRERLRDVVLPKLQYCRVISRLCDIGVICGRLIDNSSPYDAVDRHFCNFFPPCERDFRIESDDEDMVYCAVMTPRRIGLPVACVALLARSCILGIDDIGAVDVPHKPFIWSLHDILYSIDTVSQKWNVSGGGGGEIFFEFVVVVIFVSN